MSDEAKQADPAQRRPMCDHICLKDDGHVERGEPHFYGYELPSPRAEREVRERVEAERDEATGLLRWFLTSPDGTPDRRVLITQVEAFLGRVAEGRLL
jgi:hypothetical protein